MELVRAQIDQRCASHSLRSCHLGVDLHATETGAVQLLFPFDASCFPNSPAALSTVEWPGSTSEVPVAHAAPCPSLSLRSVAVHLDSSSTVCKNVSPEKAVGVVPGCFSGHSAFQRPFFLQREHLFSRRRRALRFLGVPSLSVETVDCCGCRRGCREPFTRFRASLRDAKNPRSFLGSWVCPSTFALFVHREKGIHGLRLAETFLANLRDPAGGQRLVQGWTRIFFLWVLLEFLFLLVVLLIPPRSPQCP